MWVVFALHRDMHVKRRVFGDDSFELLLGHACEIRVKLGVFVVVALRKCFCGGATSFLSPMAFFDFLIYTIHYIQYIWIHLTYIVPNSIQSASCGCCYCFLTFKASFLSFLLSWGAQGLPRHNADSLLLILVMFATVLVALVVLVLVLALCDVMYFFLILLSLSSMSATTATRKHQHKATRAKSPKGHESHRRLQQPQTATKQDPRTQKPRRKQYMTSNKTNILKQKKQKHERPLCICLIIRDNHRSVSAVYLFYVTSVSESIEKNMKKIYAMIASNSSARVMSFSAASPSQRNDVTIKEPLPGSCPWALSKFHFQHCKPSKTCSPLNFKMKWWTYFHSGPHVWLEALKLEALKTCQTTDPPSVFLCPHRAFRRGGRSSVFTSSGLMPLGRSSWTQPSFGPVPVIRR